MEKIGFLSFGHWRATAGSQTRTASDALLQTIELAQAAEDLGVDGAFVRVHHFERQLSSPLQAATSTAPAEPDTAAAAAAAAERYWTLVAAGQWDAAYQIIDPAQRTQVPESLWVGVRDGCKDPAGGALRQVSKPILANPTTAVVTVSLTGVGASLGSATNTMIYAGGHWYAQIESSSMAIYAGHTVAQAIAAAKAQNLCAS